MAPSFEASLCLILLSGFELGSCLRCRHCRSDINPNCNDAMTSSQYDVECPLIVSMNFNRANVLPLFPDIEDGAPGGSRYCHKIELADSTVIRTCMDSLPSDTEHTCNLLRGPRNGADPNKTVKRCNVCNTDACNAGQFDNGYVPPPPPQATRPPPPPPMKPYRKSGATSFATASVVALATPILALLLSV